MKSYIGLAIGLWLFNMLQGFIVASLLRKKAQAFGKKPNYFTRGAADLNFLVKKIKTDEDRFSSNDKKIITYSKLVFSLDVILAIIFFSIWIYYSFVR